MTGDMTWGGLLTSKLAQSTETEYAYCGVCRKIYQDDVITEGTIKCPGRCGCVLVRGLTRESARRLMRDNQKELLS